MAAPAIQSLSTAAAHGNLPVVEEILSQGVNPNSRSKDGMTALSVAAFWGFSDIVTCLLKHGADINVSNLGTNWTPLHCAAFQCHGTVILRLMTYKPNLELKDMRGRTAADFASAFDSIWSLFAAAGCKRTTKRALIELDVVQKTRQPDRRRTERVHFSRPESSYAVRPPVHYADPRREVAAITGDVLAGVPDEPTNAVNLMTSRRPQLTAWNS